MSDNMQPIDETLDDEPLDAVDAEATEACEVEEFDPFEGMSDEELDALCDEDDSLAGFGDVEPGFRSGFVALVGRPNAGKSTLLNACYGKKVAITSPVAQTTRRRMRAVVNRPGYQLVFVDTPGIHKPKDGLGSELNKSALFELNDVDVVAFLIDATKPIGRGDAWVAERVRCARCDNLTLGSFHHARLDDTCGLTAPCLLDVAIIGVDDSGLVHAHREVHGSLED